MRARKRKLKVIEIPVTQNDNRSPREKMGKKVAMKFGSISALRIFLWMERPLFSLGILGVLLFIAGLLSGSYVVVMKYVYGLEMTNLMGVLMLCVLFIVSSLLVIILAFLTQILITISSKLDEIEEKMESGR